MSGPNHSPTNLEKDPLRVIVDEYLVGMSAVREGTLSLYFIEAVPGKGVLIITPDNVEEEEKRLRHAFSARYPDLVPVGEEAHIFRGEN